MENTLFLRIIFFGFDDTILNSTYIRIQCNRNKLIKKYESFRNLSHIVQP